MKTKESIYGIISEISFFGFIYDALYLFILLILVNIAIIWCPVIGKYCK